MVAGRIFRWSGDSPQTGAPKGDDPPTTKPAEPPVTSPEPASSIQQPGRDAGTPESEPLVGEWRAAYLPHGWIASPRPENQIAERLLQLEKGGFSHQLHNIGFLDDSGRVPASPAEGLAAWARTSRVLAPHQQVIAWISGSESTHVDNPAVWPALVDSVAALVAEAGLDGVMLDLEPFSGDNENYPRLIHQIRERLGSTWIGVTAPVPPGTWSPAHISRVSREVDAVSPMAYDSGIGDTETYARWVAESLGRYAENLGEGTRLFPSLPAYGPNRWHDPSVENLDTIRTALESVGGVEGAAVYWWWEMGAADLEAWGRLTA